MQVAHEHAPPHSATMPLMPLRMAVSITVEPISASTVWVVPSCSMKVIRGMSCLYAVFRGLGPHLQYNAYRAPGDPLAGRCPAAPKPGHDSPDLCRSECGGDD